MNKSLRKGGEKLRIRRNISINPETFDFIAEQAKKEGRNFSNMVEAIVRRYTANIVVKKIKGK